MKKYNLATIMLKAWDIKRNSRYTFATALKLSWMEAKGSKGYTFNLESERAAVSAYLVKLVRAVKSGIADIHDIHKVEILKAALLKSADKNGVIVVDGKTCGNLKYAIRHAA